MKIIYATAALTAILLSGCAGGGGPSSIGSHGKESTLSENKLEGLYLFKIETNQNVITIHSGGDAKIGI